MSLLSLQKILSKLPSTLAFVTLSVCAIDSLHVAHASDALKRCLYISSYHQGYAWSDGVEEGIRSVLSGKCELRQFDMNTKIKKSPEHKLLAAENAKQLIDNWKPDVVITSDDNAAKYLIVPYFKDSQIPFAFSGINWTVEEYGFPFANVTGIVEVAPIEPMLSKAANYSGGRSAVYLGASTLSEEKNYSRIRKGANKMDIVLDKVLVSNFKQWLAAFTSAQKADFIVIGSNSGIENWDSKSAQHFAQENSQILSVTNHEWMMNVTTLGFTKIPQEHGEWAAEAALAILSGTNAGDIPIVTNRKWELWLNKVLQNKSNVDLPENFTRRAKKMAFSEQ